MTKLIHRVLISFVLAWAFSCTGTTPDEAPESPATAEVGRSELSLNGEWELAQGDLSDTPPVTFTHTVPVPGLVTSAEPPLDEVGLPSHARAAFWYRTSFVGPAPRDTFILTIHKAKYGIRVWLNDELLGDHHGSYTRARFDVSDVVLPDAENTLLVRVGANRNAVPASIPAGQDMEKDRWIPGIWDDVTLVGSGAVTVTNIKIEPDIDSDQVTVRVWVRNSGPAGEFTTSAVASVWDAEPSEDSVFEDVTQQIDVDETLEFELSLEMESYELWTPESPFLYHLELSVQTEAGESDRVSERFGMRKVEWRAGDDYDGRFYLNNRPYYLRGSNLTVHRFFEDPLAGGLAWDRAWVRQLLEDAPKAFSWNCFRMSVGRAPNFWYDLADELGFIIADEFMMWNALDPDSGSWTPEAMAEEYTLWIEENWNHPSIGWWDAANETRSPKVLDVLDIVRPLDTTRQWESGGFNAPHREGDPIEDHPYFFLFAGMGLGPAADLAFIDGVDGLAPGGGIATALSTFDEPTSPYIINEYAALWVNRDGTPAPWAAGAFDDLLGEGAHTADELWEAYAYIAGGLTEMWRARRGYAGVLHFTHLTYSREGGITSDNFLDIESLQMEPRWYEYAQYAFSPVGVYVHAWSLNPEPGDEVSVEVVAINDLYQPVSANLTLLLVAADGSVVSRNESELVELDALGQYVTEIAFVAPETEAYLVVAELDPEEATLKTVWSRRKVGFAHAGMPVPDPPYLDLE